MELKLKSKDITKYSLRIAKKNGKPNYDYPVVLLDNQIGKCKIERVAVIIEVEHLLNTLPGNSLKSTKSTDNSDDKNEPLLGTQSVLSRKKKCCSKCILI
jgi:hypothetical protein